MATIKTLASQNEIVDKLASQCVKCGLCLPHCPTYLLTQDENESPRGRIALFQALAQEKLPLSSKAKVHLDHCLDCRACESVCPAKVAYGQILIHGRKVLKTLPHENKLPVVQWQNRFLCWLLIQSAARYLPWLLWLMHVSGLRKLLQILRIPTLLKLSILDELLASPAKPQTFKKFYPAIGPQKGRVQLFKGCISSLFDQETLSASIYVLTRLGLRVEIAQQQTCCGAIAAHAGENITAEALAKQNIAAFPPTDKILCTATGCTAMLQDYGKKVCSDSKQEPYKTFSAQVTDINRFIQEYTWPEELKLQALPLEVVLHTPCTLRHALKSEEAPLQMLSLIPQLSLRTFSSPHCCGSAGTYMLEHPQFADALVNQLLAEMRDLKVNFIATSNIGCALHLARALKKSHPEVQVVQPITLIAKALGYS